MGSEGAIGFNVKYKLSHFQKFRILVVVAVLLLVLSIVMTVLYATKKSKGSSFPRTKMNNFSLNLCSSKDCVFSAYDMIQQLNQSVDPCEDFFQYACGGWIKHNQLKEGETRRNAFSIVQEKNNAILKETIESSWLRYPKNEAVTKSARFYNSCIDIEAVEKEGMAPLKQLMEDLGSWHVSGSNVTLPLLTRIAKMNQHISNRPLFDVNVFINPTDSNKHIVLFGLSSVGMTRDYYVTNSPENLKVREAYKQYMKDVAKLLGGRNDSDALMMEVYDFESKLAVIEKNIMGIYSTQEEYMQGTAASGFGVLSPTIQQFGKMTNTPVSIVTGFLNQVFEQQKFTFTKDDLVMAYPPKYFTHFFTLFTKQMQTDPKVLDNYAMWTVINQLIIASSSQLVEAKERFSHAMEGNKTIPRWQACIKNMQIVLKMPLGLLFVDKAFKEESKQAIAEMSKYIRQAFLNNINDYDWMDSYTKQQAREKAKAILEDIGYPDYIKDPVKLAAQLKGLQVGDKLFENTRKMLTFAIKKNYDLLKKPVDRNEWLLGPSQTNGYYAPRQNRIVFLAGILQPPFYNAIYPMYLTYGGIGMVIGHEITHGFDNQGRLYDKDGNIRIWWSPESTKNFIKRSQCLVNQYSNFEMFGTNINGNKTLNENIADNGGIKIAYDGYKAWSSAHGAEGVLPGLGLTVDQLFFVGFAQPWCSIYTKKPALVQIKVDVHSNAKYRIIGTLQNYQKFAETFKCKPDTYMNPSKKCKVW